MILKEFPPPCLQDLDRRSAGNLLSLARAMRKIPCTLVTGAGVSTSAGFPTWLQLLKNIACIYFTHWQFACQHEGQSPIVPPRNLSIAFWETFMWSENCRHLADRLVTNNAPLAVAQMILARVSKNNHQYLIRKALYGGQLSIGPSPLMKCIADLCAKNNFSAILSYNYDDVLEQALREYSISVFPIWGPSIKRREGSIPLFYPHGYLKQQGGPLAPIILGEDDYHAYSTEGYDWRNLLQLRLFSTTCCIFIGSSMTDPQVRRLLWVAKRGGAGYHYAFLAKQKSQDPESIMPQALIDAQLSDFGIRVIRYPLEKTGDRHGRLISLLQEIARICIDPRNIWK